MSLNREFAILRLESSIEFERLSLSCFLENSMNIYMEDGEQKKTISLLN